MFAQFARGGSGVASQTTGRPPLPSVGEGWGEGRSGKAPRIWKLLPSPPAPLPRPLSRKRERWSKQSRGSITPAARRTSAKTPAHRPR
ncbi:hypothetical protein DN412_18695 [Cupriavidus lacunae]|uniref:Uncharacterized protein n=1 Tax=Cupriavidus lacunae TaxID=2666307 RepID=A0A370NTC0_9BURK|nr:hypothetical protein DN412_18695 [Cupriavidus lacunae]